MPQPPPVSRFQHLAMLGKVTDRRQIIVIHAGIHRKGQHPPFGPELLAQRSKAAIGLSIRRSEMQPDIVLGRVEAAGKIALGTLLQHLACRMGNRRHCQAGQETEESEDLAHALALC